jgi:hypothetical protein
MVVGNIVTFLGASSIQPYNTTRAIIFVRHRRKSERFEVLLEKIIFREAI